MRVARTTKTKVTWYGHASEQTIKMWYDNIEIDSGTRQAWKREVVKSQRDNGQSPLQSITCKISKSKMRLWRHKSRFVVGTASKSPDLNFSSKFRPSIKILKIAQICDSTCRWANKLASSIWLQMTLVTQYVTKPPRQQMLRRDITLCCSFDVRCLRQC